MSIAPHDSDQLGALVECIRRARASFAALVAAIPDLRFRRPNDLSTHLGLDPKLAWNLGRCLEESDPFAAAQFIPGPKGMKKFLEAAARRGAPRDLVDAARSAFAEFDALVRSQAGSRKSFNSLAAGNARTVRPSTDLDHRRRAFEGSRYIFGVHARMIFRANIIMPSSDPQRWDLATMQGFVDLCRLRPNVGWRIALPVSVDADRTFHHDVQREPLDPNLAPNGMSLPLMLDYCSRPLPSFRGLRSHSGHQEFEFLSDSVGIDSRITCVTGEALRRVEPRYRNDVYDDLCITFPVRTPALGLLFDVFVHRDLFDTAEPLRAELYSDLFGGGPGLYYEPADRLPLHESVARDRKSVV